MLLTTTRTDLPAADFVERCSNAFDATTQDSGNISYGVRASGQRLFVKTAGNPEDSRPLLPHSERVAVLRNAIRLSRSVSDGALPVLHNVVEAADGPLLVYEWAEGELVGVSRARRSDPSSAFCRFRALPAAEIASALDVVFCLHVNLARRGWVACDFYDGCVMYDFARHRIRIVDLDHYRDGPFINEMGRMFGSARFMAPEEHQLGARIDERTTVFTMGRTVEQLFPSAGKDVMAVAARACLPDRESRFQSLEQFYQAWVAAARVPEAHTD